MPRSKNFILLGFLVLPLVIAWSPAINAIDTKISILPAPPENARALHLSSTEVELTWDASPSPSSGISAYQVFVKLKTDSNYPPTPQFVRTDIQSTYSQLITVLPNIGYDFKIFSLSKNEQLSSENCASCETSNAICGNGIKEPGEGCDLSDFGGTTCQQLGFSSGTPTCTQACTVQSNTCFNSGGGGGGGGGGILDTIAPDPGKASSPPMSKAGSFRISYEGAEDEGGSGLDYVLLYYKKDNGPWINTHLKSNDPSGFFNFTPQGNGIYYFDLVAFDRQGNSSPTPKANEYDTQTLYDLSPPVYDRFEVQNITLSGPLILSYNNARDIGPAGLKQVELWYKTESETSWKNTGLTHNATNGVFEFPNLEENKIYYFTLFLEDNVGNRSSLVESSSVLRVLSGPNNMHLVLSNLPPLITDQNKADIKVSGENIKAYKYQLNEGGFSPEYRLDQPLTLRNLSEGIYRLKVIGKNTQEQWQSEKEAVEYRWEVDFSRPELSLEGPYINNINTKAHYRLSYSDYDTITLSLSALLLRKNGTANAHMEFLPVSASEWDIFLKDFSGKGQLWIEVLPGTAVSRNGNKAPGLISQPLNIADNLSYQPLPQTHQPLIKPQLPYITPPKLGQETFLPLSFENLEHTQQETLKPTLIGGAIKKPDQTKPIVFLNPQSNWTISELNLTGLTSTQTRRLHLFLFPIKDNRIDRAGMIKLKTLGQFLATRDRENYFFEWESGLSLLDGEKYVLFAVGQLINGEIVTSDPLHFTFDSRKGLPPPKPLTINARPIPDPLPRTKLRTYMTKDGKVHLTGKSIADAEVVATWYPSMLISSARVDDAGNFKLSSPKSLAQGSINQIKLYAIKEINGSQIRSKEVSFWFFLNLNVYSYLFIIILLKIILLIIIKKLKKHDDMN